MADTLTEARPIPAAGWAVLVSIAAAVPLAGFAAGPLGLALPDRGVAGLLLALVVAPCVEEVVMRVLLQQGADEALRRRGWRPTTAALGAAGLASLMFAAIHLGSFSLAGLQQASVWLLPGAALAATWCWRRRTMDCVLLHAFFNAALWLAGPR